MLTAIEKARIKARKAVESLYDSMCSISRYENVKDITYEIKLFIAPEIAINQGDEIEVTNALGVKSNYKAGDGYPYNTHHEVILIKEGKA